MSPDNTPTPHSPHLQDDQAEPGARDSGQVSRRTLLTGALLTGVAAAGGLAFLRPAGAQALGPGSKAVADADRLRPRSGAVTTLELSAAPGTIDLAGRSAKTWLFNGALTAPRSTCARATSSRPRSATTSPPRPASTGTGSPCATTWTAYRV